MTEAEAREEALDTLAFKIPVRVDHHSVAVRIVATILATHDSLAVLLDPETMLRAWEKGGRVVAMTRHRNFGIDRSSEHVGGSHFDAGGCNEYCWPMWRIVPDEGPDSPTGHQWIGSYCEWCGQQEGNRGD